LEIEVGSKWRCKEDFILIKKGTILKVIKKYGNDRFELTNGTEIFGISDELLLVDFEPYQEKDDRFLQSTLKEYDKLAKENIELKKRITELESEKRKLHIKNAILYGIKSDSDKIIESLDKYIQELEKELISIKEKQINTATKIYGDEINLLTKKIINAINNNCQNVG